MRKSALAAGAVLATGLVGVTGGTAFASSGGAAPCDDNTGEDTKPSTAQTTNHANAQAANLTSSLINVQAPIAADLHEGVANDLNASNVVHDVVRVGDVVPATNTSVDQGGSGKESTGSGKSGEVSAKSSGGADAQAQGGSHAEAHAQAGSVVGSLGGSLAGAVSSATATVNAVTNVGDITVSR